MKSQGEYDALVLDYYRKQAEIDAALKMHRKFPNNINKIFFDPTDAVIIRVNYLGWGRNAWHSTWINQYHPGTIDCDLNRLKKRAEKNRLQGSQLWIETRDALWFNFQNANIMMVEINKADEIMYNHISEFDMTNGLQEFWKNPTLNRDNWLLFFELGEWRPDLVSRKEPSRYDAFPSGVGKSLRWVRQDSELNKDFFNFAESMVFRFFSNETNHGRNGNK